jgi:hypothetical protein
MGSKTSNSANTACFCPLGLRSIHFKPSAYAKEKTGTNFARQTILSAWAKNDTEGAVAWARDNFDSDAKGADANPWIVGVIEGISSIDLGRATELLEELPFSRGRGQALRCCLCRSH